MGCCGKHKKPVDAKAHGIRQTTPTAIYPADGCVLCAEKHLSTAYALAGEAGYEPVNRQRIIGELTAAALHLYAAHRETAERVREIRHRIQQRSAEPIEWRTILTEIDGLATAEAEAENGDGTN